MREGIKYKVFSKEEDRIHKESIETIRTNLGNGLKFDLACEFVVVEDPKLKELIVADALKIEIAELHYGKRLPLAEVSRRLGVSMERLLKANDEMIDDVVNTAGAFSDNASPGKRPTTH
ncbi:MAG: hypothetical protein M1497_02135 [Nitrospirae bacterium]|nr:hypothetical protein [Nitrospirota bacterium]